ncbi:MAG: DUF4919 domain-containing protein [Bacteroidales bacterium]
MNAIRVILTLLFILLISGTSNYINAQDSTVKVLDIDNIKALTTDPNSEYYYPTLVRDYMSNDTTLLSLNDFRYLYFGAAFQEDYNPYRSTLVENNPVQQLYYQDKHTAAECDSIIKYAELSLADNPMNLKQITFYIIALRERGKYARADLWEYRLRNLITAILSSGYGTEDSPWWIIYPVHEYNILNFMNYLATKHTDMGEDKDYLEITKQKRSDPDGFYFNTSLIKEMYQLKYNQKLIQ